jgi:CrcB protein
MRRGPRAGALGAPGVCGGLTTFSAFSLQVFELVREGETRRAAAYILASVVLCIAGTLIGVRVAGAS